jgi:hypothetical protein
LPCLRLLQSNRHFQPAGVSPRWVRQANGARGESMKNPLDSLWGTVISGLILTVILYFVVKSILS